ncbi:50S ribosomal protein L23 [Candidatus Daviesbacteria bacterium]|nr:50S ribosomal protein L23 [Candidatus Daviesbacteria bacterium]
MIVIKRPIITEKSMELAKVHQYTFEVDKKANKAAIAKAVAGKFNVKVISVKTLNVKGEVKSQRRVRKLYKTTGYKKAIVQTGKQTKIPLFETPKEEEAVVTTAEAEPIKLKEKKDILGRTKVKVEKSAVGAAPTTQRKVITGK